MIASFDCSAGDAYITKLVGPSTAYTITFNVKIPASTYANLASGGSASADFLVVGDVAGNEDGIWSHPGVPNWAADQRGSTFITPGPSSDVEIEIVLGLAHLSGDTWTATWTAAGSPLWAPYTTTLNVDETAQLPILVGGIYAAGSVSPQTYEISSVEVKDDTSTVIFSDDFASGDFSAWDSTVGAASVVGAAPSPTYTLELCDLATDTLLADLTGAATFTIKPRRSAQPLSVIANLAADNADIRALWTAGDGLRQLTKGIRTLKVRKNGALLGNVLVWRLDYTADENTTSVQITGYDPLILAPARVFRDATGNLINPDLASPISGATIIKDAFNNSVSNSGAPGDMEGPLPIDTSTGIFDETIPPAADMGVQLTNWPIMLDQVIGLIAQTGACDVWMTPVDTAMGYSAGVIGFLNVANRRGSDLSGTVHLDYGTGDNNVRGGSRADDMAQMINKRIYYLGPKQSNGHGWQGNIDASETTPVDLSAYATLQDDSRTKYGYVTLGIRTFDNNSNDNAARLLYIEVFKADVVASVDGQEIIKLQPTVDCAFQPFDDYNPGDSVALNVADIFGPALTGALQRIDGFDVAVDVDGVGTVSEIQTLQDS